MRNSQKLTEKFTMVNTQRHSPLKKIVISHAYGITKSRPTLVILIQSHHVYRDITLIIWLELLIQLDYFIMNSYWLYKVCIHKMNFQE